MNESLQGWRLALALLIPALIIGAAGYIAYGALSGDDQDVATGSEEVIPTATPLPETEPVERSLVSDPTPVAEPAPTALVIPTVEPVAAVATVEVDETEVDETEPDPTPEPPAPTAAPAPAAPAAPSGPAPTATPDASIITLACGGTFPSTIESGVEFGPLTANLSPADSTASYQFVWDIGNSTTVTNPSSGTISYADAGTYTVLVTGTDSTNAQTVSANCGTVTVTKVVAPFVVRCSVSSFSNGIALADAKPQDAMQVTTTWTPADALLDLTYEFETSDKLIIEAGASSGNQQTNVFNFPDSAFSIFWRDPGSGETGLLSCPAYPGLTTAAPTPTSVAGVDSDDDGIADTADNCPAVANTDQANNDGDAPGDECDDDDDNDNRVDLFDNCPKVSNFDQIDSDINGIGDACEVAPTPTPTEIVVVAN